MAFGRKVRGARQVGVRELRQLLALPSTRDEDLSERGGCEVRQLSDGRMLGVFGNGRGILYPSRGVLDDMLREAEEMASAGPVNLVKTLIPPAGDFIRDVGAHAARLAATLRVPAEALDGSPDSLLAVDKALKRIKSSQRMTPEIVTPLVAYIGELLRRACDGRWEISEQSGGGAPEPTILGREDLFYQPFSIVVLAFDPDHRSSLHSAVEVALKMPVRKSRGPAPEGMQYVYIVGARKPPVDT